MMKVLLVDDEPLVLEGLRTIVNWEKYGFRVCGEATSGNTALALIEQLRPELVLTDIHMPTVSGLELINRSQSLLERPPYFVILSGYDSFDYAVTAIGSGVEDYLLKPIDEEEIEAVLEQMGRKIRTDAEEEQLRFRHRDVYLQHLLDRLIRGEDNEELKREAAELLDIREGQQLCCLLVEAGPEHRESEIRRELERLAASVQFHLFMDHEDRAILLASGPANAAQLLESGGERLCAEWSGSSGVPLIAALSGGLCGISAIRPLYEKALMAINCKRYQMEGGLHVCDEAPLPKQESSGELNPSALAPLLEMLTAGAADSELAAAVERLLTVTDTGLPTADHARLYLSALELDICKKLKEMNGDADAFMRELRVEFGTLELMEFLPVFKRYAIALCSRAAAVLQNQQDRNENSTIFRVVQYVDTHFRDKLQVQDLGRLFHMNSNYLGQLFRQHTGQSFREYLNERRIDEAKRLLRHAQMSITEVAAEVGYPSADYFICQFKKTAGVVPSVYRKQGREGCEW